MDKLHGDVSVATLKLWVNRWNDFFHLNRLDEYPVAEQAAALRMAMDISMQRVVEFTLEIKPTDQHTPAHILEEIRKHLRGNWQPSRSFSPSVPSRLSSRRSPFVAVKSRHILTCGNWTASQLLAASPYTRSGMTGRPPQTCPPARHAGGNRTERTLYARQ